MADIDRDGNKNFTFGIMKKNCWLVLGTMLTASAVAQVNTNALWSVPPPLPAVTNAPATPTTLTVAAPAPTTPPVKKKTATAAKKQRPPATKAAKTKMTEPIVTLVP